MKKFKMVGLLACMVLAGATVSAQSVEKQGRKGGEPLSATEMAEKRTARMTEALSLTEEQQKQVQQLNLECAQKAESRKAEMEAERTKLREILTPEQYAQWEQMSKSGAHRGHGKHDGDAKCSSDKKGCAGNESEARSDNK